MNLRLLAVAAFLLLPACKSAKARDCAALVPVIDAQAANLKANAPETRERSPTEHAKVLRQVAALKETAAAAVEGVKVESPEMKRMSTDYQWKLRQVGKAMTELATGLESGDKQRYGALTNALNDASKVEPEMVADIKRVCSE